MNQFWKEMCIAGVLGIVLPGIVLGVAVKFLDEGSPGQPTEPVQTEGQKTAAEIPVLTDGGVVTQMALSDYLTGVVLAEMPASFEEEALKAQAVVARTYAVRTTEKGTKHDGAVCTDSACCQGYISADDYEADGGTKESVQRVRNAVTDTENYVLTYDGALIEATYFSCSGGSTEDAVAVWGTDVPYLQAVDSPGEEHASHYTDTVSFSPEEFADALGLELSGDPDSWIGIITYTDGGGVDTMVIGGTEFRGTRLRSALGLRSTAFSISCSSKSITVTTKGYGHRVGMSQYGADAMAASGSSYGEILRYYYQGTQLEPWID